MSSSKASSATAPASSSSSTTSSSTLPSGSSRPMTWAERLAGKPSSSSSSTSPSSSQTQVSRRSNGRPASSSVSASSSSQADSVSAPGNTPLPASSSTKSNSQKNTRTSSNGSNLNDSNNTTLSASATSPGTVKSRIPTSADSGWGEAESSMESRQADNSRARTQSNTRIPSTSASDAGQAAVPTKDIVDTSKIDEADNPSTSAEPVKASPGPPKVNIWQVRKEEAARKAAEQAKLKKEQEEVKKQQQPSQASTSKLPAVSQEKTDTGSSNPSSPTTTKSGKKKRIDAQPQAAASANGSAGIAGNNANKGKDSNKKASGNKQAPQSTPSTSKQLSQQINTSKAGTVESEITAPSTTPANQSDWPSPGEEKEREDAEGQKKTHTTKESIDGAPISDQTKPESGTGSPSRSKKQTWKTIQSDITINSPLPSRKSSDSSKPVRNNSKSPKQPAPETSTSNASSSKDMSRASSRQSNKAQTPSDKQAVKTPSLELSSATVSASSAQDDTASDAPATTSQAVASSAKLPVVGKILATSPSIASKGSATKQHTFSPPLPSSLPAKPIGAPTSDPSRSRLSPSMHGATPIRSRQSPATTAQGVTSNNASPMTVDQPASSSSAGTTAAPYSDAADATRSPPVRQAQLSPIPGFASIPPVASSQPGFYPSIAPMPQYSNHSGRGKRGGLNGNGSGRNGVRGGNAGSRASNYNYSRNQSPNAYGSGFTSPIMGHQTLYQPPQGYSGPLPPNVYFDQAQMQTQYNPQLDTLAPPGAFNNNGMQRYYPPFMYPPHPAAVQDPGQGPYFLVGSPSQQSSTRPGLPQQGRQMQQVFPTPPPPPPRSTAPSEASQLSQPDSPMPAPRLPQGTMPAGAPVFQAMPTGYPPQMPDGTVPPNMPFASPPPPPSQVNTIPPPFSPPQMPPQQFSQAQQSYPQGAQPQGALNASVLPPVYAKPSPLYDYSFIMFPPDGTAFWVLGQIEFYFSADNLARDTFLRQSMDEEGWVDVALIASFKRLNSLSQDIHLIRSMMELSFMCEVREMKVRTKEWKSWVLPGARKVNWQYPEPQPQQQTQQLQQHHHQQQQQQPL